MGKRSNHFKLLNRNKKKKNVQKHKYDYLRKHIENNIERLTKTIKLDRRNSIINLTSFSVIKEKRHGLGEMYNLMISPKINLISTSTKETDFIDIFYFKLLYI